MDGAYAFYGTSGGVSDGNSNTTGSKLSDNRDNVMAKTGSDFGGIYAASVAFSGGEGKDNYVAELRAYGDDQKTIVGKEEIAITVSAPTGHSAAPDAARGTVFTNTAKSGISMTAIPDLTNISLAASDGKAMVSANCAFGSFELPSTSIAGTVLAIGGYQSNITTSGAYKKAAYRFAYIISASFTGYFSAADTGVADWLEAKTHMAYPGGYTDGSFQSNAAITPAEVTTIVNRMLNRSADTSYAGAHEKELRLFPDVKNTFWAYYAILEAANVHSHTLDNGKETWTGLD